MIRTGITLIRTAKFPPPVGRLRKSLFVLEILANIYYFALWLHHIIHTNLNCCSRSNPLFTFSRSRKSIIFRCFFKTLTKRKSKAIENDKDHLQNSSTWASKFISQHHVFIGILLFCKDVCFGTKYKIQ